MWKINLTRPAINRTIEELKWHSGELYFHFQMTINRTIEELKYNQVDNPVVEIFPLIAP